MIGAILLEIVTFIGTLTMSYIYEGKALLKLGKENYKIKLGKLESYNKDLEQNLFPPFFKDRDKFKFYLEYTLCFIPGINLLCAHIKGKKRCKTIVDNLAGKGIISPMTDEEIDTYINAENILDKIYYLVFNSMDSHKEYESEEEAKDTTYSEEVKEVSEKIKKEAYERDISYMEAMISLENTEEKPKEKKLKKTYWSK